MFKKNSLLNDVNILNKLICLIGVLIGLILVKEPVFLLLISVLLLIITRDFKYLFRVNLLAVITSLINIVFPHFLWISKICLLIDYIFLLKEVTKAKELRYVLEKTLYRFQSKEITYYVLYVIYFSKYYKNNFKNIISLKKEYQLEGNYKFYKFTFKRSYKKTKTEMNELMNINKLRFYNHSSKRTYIEEPKWQRWDNTYILIHLIILITAYIYGR